MICQASPQSCCLQPAAPVQDLPHNTGTAWWSVSSNIACRRPLAVQVERLHNVKCRELGAGVMTMPRNAPQGRSSRPKPGRTVRRTYASEDNTVSRRHVPTVSVPDRPAQKHMDHSPLRGSWRARTAATATHHASDSDLAALGAQPEISDHGIVMGSGLYQAPKARGAKGSDPTPCKCAAQAPRETSPMAERGGDVDHATHSSVETPRTSEHHDSVVRRERNTASTLPRVDSFATPFEATCEPVCQPCEGMSSAVNVPLDVAPSPQAPETPPIESDSTGKNGPLKAEKASFLNWLPGHVTGIEQEALQLGVERTGPFFHNAANETPLEDVVEINISGCRQSDCVSASSPPGHVAPPCDHSNCDTAASLHSSVTEGECMADDDAMPSRSCGPAAAVRLVDVGARISGSSSSAYQSGFGTARSIVGASTQPSTLMHEPYTLTAVGHSLGGAALLMYIVQFRRTQRRHRLSRLVLLTPAGFMDRIPSVVRPIALMLPASLRLITWMFPAVVSLPFYVPSSVLRSLMFRLTADVSSMPALSKLVRCAPGPAVPL